MKMNLKQTRVRPLFFKIFCALFAVTLFVAFSSSTGYAPTQMSDSELSEIEGQAFFKIEHFPASSEFWDVVDPSGAPVGRKYNTGSQNVIRISMGIDVEAHAFIESQKMGYYNGGWDQDHTNFWVGDRSSTGDGGPLRLNGLYIDLGYDNIGNAANRTLNYVEIGSMRVTGNVTQTINSINGLIAAGTGANNGVMLRQTASGTRVVNFNNEIMSFVFASKYNYESNANSTNTVVSGIFLKIPSYHSGSELQRP
ncbi:MAG TPA: hypothetical protein PLV40_08925 [Smithella sp.]|jgi:hypothetical protein|nr:hypothetical protein [Smithella sp.]